MTGPEELAGRHDTVACLEQRQQREEHRRHAGRGRTAGLGTFERSQPVLEHADGRIAEAGVLVVVALAFEGRLGFLGAGIGVARGQEQRFRRLVEIAAHLAAAHCPGLRPPLRGIGSGLLLGNRTVHHTLSSRLLPTPRTANEKPPTWKDGGFFEHSDLLAMFNVVASRSAQITTGVSIEAGRSRRKPPARAPYPFGRPCAEVAQGREAGCLSASASPAPAHAAWSA